MTDKDRQRQRERVSTVPHGRMPNWALIAVAGAIVAVALIARALI